MIDFFRNISLLKHRFSLFLFSIFIVPWGITVEASGENVEAHIEENQVVVEFTSNVTPDGDDGKLYLFAETYDTKGISTSPIASKESGKNITFTVNLDKDNEDSKLYTRFVVGKKSGNGYMALNPGAYVTNPEACATYSPIRKDHGKKGILVDALNLINSRELKDLGVQQAIYNIPINDILGPTSLEDYPTIKYKYKDKTYEFNGMAINMYDQIFRNLTKNNIQITATILNNRVGDDLTVHPDARRHSSAHYYMFNVAEEDGIDTLEAVGSFLANRYSGRLRGQVDNWIVGNEVNASNDWCYFGDNPDIDDFADAYAKSVRLFYNAIKSENANARVYTCFDQNWNSNDVRYFNAMELVEKLDGQFKKGGNFDWGIAEHPYNTPQSAPAFWKQESTSRVTHDIDTPMLTMANIDAFTDYMCQDEMLDSHGEVRSIILSEQGYTSSHGEDLQAASVVFAYLTVMNNQHIDSFLLSRQTDSPEENAMDLHLGLTGKGGTHKMAYEYYKNVDGPNADRYISATSKIIGKDVMSLVIKR